METNELTTVLSTANKDEVKEAATKTETPLESSNANPKEKEIQPKVPFKCEECNFQMDCDYKGTKPPFAKNIQFDVDSYVMVDPFSPPPSNLSSKSNSEYFIVIGSDCANCDRSICSASNCSIFYRKSYCGSCAHQMLNQFPVEIQSKIRKCLSSKNVQ